MNKKQDESASLLSSALKKIAILKAQIESSEGERQIIDQETKREKEAVAALKE